MDKHGTHDPLCRSGGPFGFASSRVAEMRSESRFNVKFVEGVTKTKNRVAEWLCRKFDYRMSLYNNAQLK